MLGKTRHVPACVMKSWIKFTFNDIPLPYLSSSSLVEKLCNLINRCNLNFLCVSSQHLKELLTTLPLLLGNANVNVRPVKLNWNSFLTLNTVHPLLELYVRMVKNLERMLEVGSQGKICKLSGSVVYLMLPVFIALCLNISVAKSAQILKNCCLGAGFCIHWAITFTSCKVKHIPGMIKIPLHHSFRKNLFICFGPSKEFIDGIISANKRFKFISGVFKENDVNLLNEIVKFCVTLSPLTYGYRFTLIELMRVYLCAMYRILESRSKVSLSVDRAEMDAIRDLVDLINWVMSIELGMCPDFNLSLDVLIADHPVCGLHSLMLLINEGINSRGIVYNDDVDGDVCPVSHVLDRIFHGNRWTIIEKYFVRSEGGITLK